MAVPTAAPGRPAAPAPTTPRRRRRRSDSSVAPAFYWMALPAFVLFFVFHTVPALTGIWYSFTDSPGYGPSEFVGLRNYVALFSDTRVRDAYLFTFQFAIAATVLTNAIALALAVALNGRIHAKGFFRGVYFVPKILAVLVIGYIFNYFFATSLPAIASAIGLERLSTSVLADEDLAWLAVLTLAVWQAVAFNIIIYIAGLQTVPGELYEAARVDGAGTWRQFRSITFPMIAGFFTINMVLSLKDFMQVFDHIIAMTGGGPGTATESVPLVIYRGGFQGGEYGYQTANAVVFLVVIVVFSLVQLRTLQRREISA